MKMTIEDLKEIWDKNLRNMQKIVDETYYNLCSLWMYWDIYERLQKMHCLLDNYFEDEYIDEDEIGDIRCFYKNNFQN